VFNNNFRGSGNFAVRDAVGVDVDIVDDFACSLLRRIWDPGIDCLTIWDPGIHGLAHGVLAEMPLAPIASPFDLLLAFRALPQAARWNVSGDRSFAMARRLIWDPGIASFAIVGAMGMPVCFEVFRRRPPAPLHASIGSMSPRMLRLTRHRHSILADQPKTHDVASVGLLFCEAPASATVQSIFHCSHPVLSRPTVPNIDT